MKEYKRLTKRDENGFVRVPYYLKGEEDIAIKDVLARLAELEDKIENGTLIDITEKFITEEEIKNKTRHLICEHYLTKMVVDFADSKAEAEAKLKELNSKQ